MAIFLLRLSTVILKNKTDEAELEFLSRELTMYDLEKMDVDQDGSVSREEFVHFMLQAMGKVTEQDLYRLTKVFHKFDVTSSGTISMDDLILMNSFMARKIEYR